jgi:hypothetical protein
MYQTRTINRNSIENNAYLSAGLPYQGGKIDKTPWWEMKNSEDFKPLKSQRSPENAERG